jgi:two-component system sensor histidine kinase YesM
MKLPYSLRMRLAILFMLTLIVPVVTIVYIMPSYYHALLTRDTTQLTESVLIALTKNIGMYLEDLERLAVSPYMSEEVMRALKGKSNPQYGIEDLYTQYETEKALSVTLPTFLRNNRKDILGTILLPFDDSVYVTSVFSLNGPVEDFPYKEQEWYLEALEADGRVAFIGVHPQDYLKIPSPSEVFSVARLIKDPDTGKPLAVMMADADTKIFADIVRDIPFNVSSIIAILDQNDQLIYASGPLPNGTARQLSKQIHTSDPYVIVSRSVPSAGWRVVVYLSNAELKERFHGIYLFGALLAGGGLLLTGLLFFVLSIWIINPFKEIILVMRKVQKGEMRARVAIRGKDEIAELGQAFNTMIAQLNDVIESEYKVALSLRNAEYRALQSQIQPHFLYNTLNGFIALNRIGERKLLEKSIVSLSEMLRYILKSDLWSSIGDEIQFLRKYCEIQQLRFQDKMGLVFQTDPATEAFQMPKLLLQPIVENAIIHGIEPMDRPCTLRIESRYNETRTHIIIRVTDDGKGFDTTGEVDAEDIGLANVRRRLHLMLPEAVMAVESRPGAGTTVTFLIPLGA